MFDRDAVIRHAAAVSENDGYVPALFLVAASKTLAERAFHEGQLRTQLIALASGFEPSSLAGSTYPQRLAAAKAALAAWDGPVEAEGRAIIRIGSRTVHCDQKLASQAGWEPPHANDPSRSMRDPVGWPERLAARLAQALGEGLDGDEAIARVLVLGHEYRSQDEARASAERVAHANEKAAGMHLAAEREASKRHAR